MFPRLIIGSRRILRRAFAGLTRIRTAPPLTRSVHPQRLPPSTLILDADKPTIVFVVDFLLSGGVETRLLKINEFLKKGGYNTIFVFASAHNQNYNAGFNYGLLALDIVFLDIQSNLFLYELLKITTKWNVRVIEFQFKWPLDVNYASLKRYCETQGILLNCTIHGVFKTPDKILQFSDNFDHVIFVGNYIYFEHSEYEDFERARKHPAHRMVPNGIIPRMSQSSLSVDPKSSSVLMISRVNYDKLSSIVACLNFCRKHGLRLFLLGDAVEAVKTRLIDEFGMIQEDFLGYVDTYTYVTENCRRYLFFAGVDQVALEVASLGLPVLIATYDQDLAILKRSNYRRFSVNLGHISPAFRRSLLNTGNGGWDLMKEAVTDLELLRSNQVDAFDLREMIEAERDIRKILEKDYLPTLGEA